MNSLSDMPNDWSEIYSILVNHLGNPEELHQSSPLCRCSSALEILIATILTQATSDRNAMKAWQSFQNKYDTFEAVVAMGPETLSETIRPAGMASQRTKVIFDVLKEVYHRFGTFSLDSLANDPDGAWAFLTGLPGIGPKTAACTMLFGLKFPCFPVDVHIERIAKRLGWANLTASPAEIQQKLAARIPAELLEGMHILLLNLGRKYCRPRTPNCAGCPIRERCVYQRRFT